MKCFIHTEKDAVAICKKCGKGMCSNCSAYNRHTGICPECRKEDFLMEVIQLKEEEQEWKKVIFKRWFFTILFSWTVIGLFYGIYKIAVSKAEREKRIERIKFLQGEILKLEQAKIAHGEGVI